MLPKVHYSKIFRQHMGSILKEHVETNQDALIYNEKYPTQSFFILSLDNYLNLLSNDQNKQEINNLLNELNEKRSDRFRSMVIKRYAKSI